MLVQSLGQEDPLEEGVGTHSSVLPREPRGQQCCWAAVHGVTESQTRLSGCTHTLSNTALGKWMPVGALCRGAANSPQTQRSLNSLLLHN